VPLDLLSLLLVLPLVSLNYFPVYSIESRVLSLDDDVAAFIGDAAKKLSKVN